MSSTRPECSSGTDHVNRHAELEDPRAAVFNYVPYAIPKDEWAPVADFTRESVLMVHPRCRRRLKTEQVRRLKSEHSSTIGV